MASKKKLKGTDKLEATAIIAPMLRAGAKAASQRRLKRVDKDGNVVGEISFQELREGLAAQHGIEVDVKAEMREGSRGCLKCGELRKERFSRGNALWCRACKEVASKCSRCDAPINKGNNPCRLTR